MLRLRSLTRWPTEKPRFLRSQLYRAARIRSVSQPIQIATVELRQFLEPEFVEDGHTAANLAFAQGVRGSRLANVKSPPLACEHPK
jgi:hypothetical protein